MNGTSKKVLGVVLVCTSAIGFLLSIFLLFQVWHYRQPVTEKLQSGLDHASSILQTTDDALAVIDQVVNNVLTSTLYIDEATSALAQTMQSTSSFMDSAGTFVGEDLISTITNTQTALSSAQASAVVIDNILSSISNIPLIGINYDPKLPLNQALGQVSASLDPVQESLKNFQTNLNSTQANLQELTGQISTLDKKITTINTNLVQAQTTIYRYRAQVNSLISSVDKAKASLPAWITSIAWLLTMIILWLVMTQIGIFVQGILLLAPDRRSQDIPGENQ
jgi:ABC-type transporter Mla subunit MlaD